MRRVLVTGVLAALMLSIAPVTHLCAQDGPGATQERLARELREQGVEAARTGDWLTAKDRFQRSYDLDPRILTLYNLAAAQLNSGALVEADENFRQFLRATDDGSHAEFRAESERSRANLATRIATLTLTVENIGPGDRVEIGGQDLAQAALGAALPMNPGFHRIAVFRNSAQIAEETITLTEGASSALSVDIPVAAAPTVPTASETAASSEAVVATNVDPLAADSNDDGGGNGALIGVIIGVVAVAGLVVGGYFLFRGDDEEPFQGSLGTVDFR
ncbi:MAG: hypothetical protein AB8H86_02805 [Polyangiales bacterium]